MEGFVYAHDDEGMKAINIELHGEHRVHNFHFVVPVPGLPSDYFDLEEGEIYAANEIQDLDSVAFQAWLANLRCCASNDDGEPGDPLNVVFIGDLETLRSALISTHWDVTAPISGASLRRMLSAFIFGSRYRYAPISPLYLFGREHDLAFQKARAVIDERNHMRLWLAPTTFEDQKVWVGQISRDVGIKLSGKFWPPTTHIVDPDMDDARFYILQEMIDSGAVGRIGFVRGHEPAQPDAPHFNAEGDPYFTDGLRSVMFLSEVSVRPSQVELLGWRMPSMLRDNQPSPQGQ